MTIWQAATQMVEHAEVKRLDGSDREQFHSLLLSLDDASRAARFNGWTSDAQLRSHTEHALSSADWIAGAFVQTRLRGVVEIYGYDHLGFAEASFIVVPEWRRQGFATLLLHAAMDWCRQSGQPLLRMVFSRTNLPMRRLVAKTPARLDLAFDEMSAEIALRSQLDRQAIAGRSTHSCKQKSNPEGDGHATFSAPR